MQSIFTPGEINRIRNIPIMFIVGKGRSGTTLLQVLLNNHPNVIGPPESMFIPLLYPRFHNVVKWSDKDIKDFVEALYSEKIFKRSWGIDEQQLIQSLSAVKEHADFTLMCKMVCYQLRKDKKEIILISFKTPDLTLFTGKLLKLFPEAKFIHLVREPRGNVYSHLEAFNVKNTVYIAQKWLRYNKLVENKKMKTPERFFTLKYEELVTNLNERMKELCFFLNINYLDEWSHKVPDEVKLEGKPHKPLSAPVSISNIEKWRSGMKLDDKIITEFITASYAHKQYKYDLEKIIGRVPYFRILKGEIIYYVWELLTYLRYKSFFFNIMYNKCK